MTVAELEEAEKVLVKDAQSAIKPLIQKNEFRNLAPFIDDDGIIRVGGRIENAPVSYETRHPPIIPRCHWLSTLIVRRAHQYGHLGVAATAGKTRKRFWIVGVHHIAKSVKFKCVFCRQRAQKNEIQMMANLPPYRLAPFTPPFFYTAVDLFGPIKVKVGRNKTDKYWGVLFTCRNVRAVYIDVATDYSTPVILPVLKRFFCIRGYPRCLWSDRGSQLVGGEAELRKAIEGRDTTELKYLLHEKGME